jgi:hypothetical protein
MPQCMCWLVNRLTCNLDADMAALHAVMHGAVASFAEVSTSPSGSLCAAVWPIEVTVVPTDSHTLLPVTCYLSQRTQRR